MGQYEDAVPDTAADVPEVHRLPLLLRLLSASRPLASLPDLKEMIEEDDDKKPDDNVALSDEWLDTVVQRLEDRAALYSAAEGTEVLAGHLAPYVCRKWSKLPALVRHKTTGIYDTTALEGAARPAPPPRRRKMSETSLGALSEEGNVLDDYNRIDPHDEDEEEDEALDQHDRKRRKQSTSSFTSITQVPPIRRQSTATLSDRDVAAEDSQQSLATKSWTELALLVAQSLQQPLSPNLALTVDEASILAQSTKSSEDSSSMLSADLSATLCSLLHHTPVLRYHQVAVRVNE